MNGSTFCYYHTTKFTVCSLKFSFRFVINCLDRKSLGFVVEQSYCENIDVEDFASYIDILCYNQINSPND